MAVKLGIERMDGEVMDLNTLVQRRIPEED